MAYFHYRYCWDAQDLDNNTCPATSHVYRHHQHVQDVKGCTGHQDMSRIYTDPAATRKMSYSGGRQMSQKWFRT